MEARSTRGGRERGSRETDLLARFLCQLGLVAALELLYRVEVAQDPVQSDPLGNGTRDETRQASVDSRSDPSIASSSCVLECGGAFQESLNTDYRGLNVFESDPTSESELSLKLS